jgi:hypothetical protein
MDCYFMRNVITDVLSKLTLPFTPNHNDIDLVASTLMNETRMGRYMTENSAYAGMASMDKETLKWFGRDTLKANKRINQDIYNVSSVDMDVMGVEKVESAVETNIAFMIAVVYFWYIEKHYRPTNMEDIEILYEKWPGLGSKSTIIPSLADFKKQSRTRG